jgi:hypothetical protein
LPIGSEERGEAWRCEDNIQQLLGPIGRKQEPTWQADKNEMVLDFLGSWFCEFPGNFQNHPLQAFLK